MTSRVCTYCGVEKPVSAFHREQRRASGYSPRCGACARGYARAWQADPARASLPSNDKNRRRTVSRRRHSFGAALKHNYGIGVEDFARMYYAQRCACAVCREFMDLEVAKSTHVDHDHMTGAVRGLLCAPCNKGLGVAEESIPRLLSMAAYLETHAVVEAE